MLCNSDTEGDDYHLSSTNLYLSELFGPMHDCLSLVIIKFVIQCTYLIWYF